MFPSLLVTLCFLSFISAGAPAYSRATIPTDSPIAGKYTGLLRPQIHFSPPKGFMNDPNGCYLDADGLYHLYYQYNPTDTIAGNQHWGHATSRDLYHWENQKIAIFPANSTEGIYTGSAIIDVNNTSGFFSNQTNGVVAIYTLNTPDQQTQNLAYSVDNGYTFMKYSGNPVLEAGSLNFRDPKVIWHAPTQKWVMVVSYTMEFTIGIFTSTNLINWTHASNFSHHGILGSQYECPNMVEIPMENATAPMYIMYISINPGAPLGGSISQYFPGTFNGTHFTAVDGAARIADFGKDNYAGQFFYGTPADHLLSIDWASNWEYTDYVPTGPLEGWQSAMSLPRTNYLANITRAGYDLISAPYNLSAVMPSSPLAKNDSLENGTLLVDFSSVASNCVFLEINITSLNSTALSNTASANFTLLSSTSGESLVGGQFLASGSNFFLNRGSIRGLDNNPFFTDKFSTSPTFTDTWTMSAVFDRSVFEVFLLGGLYKATVTVFPEYPLDTLVVRTGGLNTGAKVSVAAWGLQSGWAGSEDATTGTVVGNVTMEVKRDKFGYLEF